MAAARAAALPLAHRSVLVVGLGRTGLAMSRFLCSAGARVRACDRRADVELPAQLQSVEVVRGADGPELLDAAQARGELEVVEGAGHMTPVERPAELGAILRRFLTRLQ